MASSYSSNLKLELIGTGDQSGTWGNTTNTNLGTLLEQAIVGYTTQAITDGADTTITIADGASSVARNYTLVLTGALTANRNLIVPAIQKSYIIFNNTSGGFSVTVKVSGQTGVTVANGKKAIVYNNGTDIVEVVNAPVTEAGTQTLTNKTLTTPVLSGTASGTTAGRLGYLSGALSYGTGSVQRTVVNTDEAQTLTNKTLTTPVLSGTASGTTAGAVGYLSGALSYGTGSVQRTVVNTDEAQTLTNKTWNGNAIGAAYGGTGATTLTANNVILGNGTSAVQFVAPGTNGNLLTSNGTTWTSAAAPATTGRLLRAPQFLTSGTTYTTPAGCTNIYVEMMGGGGGGGGCNSNGPGGGGGNAILAWKYVTVSPSTAYTIAVGAGGTGVSGAAGNNGGNTTITVGATTYTSGGGGGGAGSATSTPGSSGTATNTDGSVAGTAASGSTGGAPNTMYGLFDPTPGPGTATSNDGNNAKVYGSGGSGAYSVRGTTQIGGNGSQGFIRVWEYS